ncbi:TetR/AcrR family transcriptional regulator [Nesterenkonia sphaerica]|uniref:TetR/AcrR family transcriptional regulator n=2 Tax=Nesterenkonia sphaerica TaxID=1804988 RepID=A0A5R8ZYA6_9MICC|nr:TetR/AcrR family transcriptional regulator [Nesterenkonia sphaerica]
MDPRIARSRRAIIDAATTLFLNQGYPATTMDDIAEVAGVSKRTVYNNFPDKEGLFREVVLAVTSFVDEFINEAVRELADAAEVELSLKDLAARLASSVIGDGVVRLRRLIIGEAHRFPDLAADYYRRAPGRVIATLAIEFGELTQQGRLHTPDPELAAEQFAYLTIGAPLDRALFHSHDVGTDSDTLVATAIAGVTTFLAAYGPEARGRRHT